MKSIKKTTLQLVLASMFLGGGLITGGITNANASSECPRTACNGDDCEWFGNMTKCEEVDGECTDLGNCGPPPTDPVEN